MDDLDHSMHIAEHDWTSFYEESEECSLPQPLLACTDNWSLSDFEDSVITPKAEEDDERWLKSDLCLSYPAITTEGLHIATTMHAEQRNLLSLNGESSGLEKEEGDGQTESDTSTTHKPGPLSCNQREVNVNAPYTTDRAVSTVAVKTEKERWFVTVNDSHVRQRLKKKKRQKKPCKNNHICQTPGKEQPQENGLLLEMHNESMGVKYTNYVTQSNQNKGGCPSPEEIPESALMEVIFNSSQISLDSLSKKLVMVDGCDQSSPASVSHHAFTPKGASGSDSVGSDSYLSATESAEEPQQLLTDQQQLQGSSSLMKKISVLSPTEDTDYTQDREQISNLNTLSCNVTAANCEGCESTTVKQTLLSLSAVQSVNKMPNDNSTCNNDTHSEQLNMPSETPGPKEHEISLSASVCSSADQLSLPPVPDVTLTTCSVADSPETYATAAGNTHPVSAISSFWDEMEKLTINDILQLRMGRSTPPRDMQKTASACVDDFPTNHSSLADTMTSNDLSDRGLIDTSDTADSDYSSQLDESKPDRSSFDFSTSDFEEEYWQFLGTSRNCPDIRSKKQQRKSASPSPAHEEEESAASAGKETPVSVGQHFENQDSADFISTNLMLPTPIKKSRSVSCPPLEGHDSLETQIPVPFLPNTDALDQLPQICSPEVFEYFIDEDKTRPDFGSVIVYNPEDISVAPASNYTLCLFKDEASFSFLHYPQCREEKPIPVFSCSHPTIRELTFPNYIFLRADSKVEEGAPSPFRVVSHSFVQGSDGGMSAAASLGFHIWQSLRSVRKVSSHDNGSMWYKGSGAWVFPAEAEMAINRTDPITVVTKDRISSTSPQLCRELAEQQRILETVKIPRPEGIFSKLKQSDMCLVCIAFASWVLRSSDQQASDAWKAALLANVSALSAIRYLRQYVKKNPSRDDL
uniref:PGC-1 and ERR-induced regulator in muscle protein 1 n=1 Tax=Mola mola TaxID=94237 RepID=A0A3Q3XS83_MOLML